MAVTDLHSLDISAVIDKMFTERTAKSVVLSLIPSTPQISVGQNEVLVMGARARGALVHEGGSKPDNGRKPVSRPFTTAKLVYSQRVTDEFMMWDRQRQGDFVARLVDDWTRRSLPADLDIVVMHGIDPNTGALDTELSDYMTKPGSSVLVPSTGETASAIDTDFATAITELGKNGTTVNGIAIAPEAAAKLATVMNGNVQKYTGLGPFGLIGDNLAGKPAAESTAVAEANNTKMILGDWGGLFLGFAGNADWKTIEYGDPDGTGVDLQNVNQVCIRLELKFGFRVLDTQAFAVIANPAGESES